MKKTLTAALMSAVVLGLSASAATAGWLKRKCCGHKCATFCVKPYNAFSPVAYGSLTFDGITPRPYGPPAHFAPQFGHGFEGEFCNEELAAQGLPGQNVLPPQMVAQGWPQVIPQGMPQMPPGALMGYGQQPQFGLPAAPWLHPQAAPGFYPVSAPVYGQR
jgi:hypothetical protein